MSGLPQIRRFVEEFHATLRAIAASGKVIAPEPPASAHQGGPDVIVVQQGTGIAALATDVGEEELVTEPMATESFADHHFDDGWCVDCGISAEVALARGWKCETVGGGLPARSSPRPATESMHVYASGNRCQRCGIRRDTATSSYCAAPGVRR